MSSDSLEATNYVHRGNSIILRSALPFSDSESWVSLWKNKFGNLEGFPWEDVFGDTPSHSELIRMGLVECPLCGRGL